jgi:hypothetical protein
MSVPQVFEKSIAAWLEESCEYSHQEALDLAAKLAAPEIDFTQLSQFVRSPSVPSAEFWRRLGVSERRIMIITDQVQKLRKTTGKYPILSPPLIFRPNSENRNWFIERRDRISSPESALRSWCQKQFSQ